MDTNKLKEAGMGRYLNKSFRANVLDAFWAVVVLSSDIPWYSDDTRFDTC